MQNDFDKHSKIKLVRNVDRLAAEIEFANVTLHYEAAVGIRRRVYCSVAPLHAIVIAV